MRSILNIWLKASGLSEIKSRWIAFSSDWKGSLLTCIMIGGIVAISSQIYMNMFVNGFRISLAVIVLPLLLLTLGSRVSMLFITIFLMASVFLLRIVIMRMTGISATEGMEILIPNMIFYLTYCLFFSWLFPDRRKRDYHTMYIYFVVIEFLANMFELCVTSAHTGNTISLSMMVTLGIVALIRSALAWLIMLSVHQYEDILTLRERESQYQELFMKTSSLKNELYFMRKNSEEIESVMGHAYRLYEELDQMDLPEEMRQRSLAIAKDVHEIKKDYLRIIQGIEQDISGGPDVSKLKLTEMIRILQATSEKMMAGRDEIITFDFYAKDDFITDQHYELMAVLKNIVGNAMEAIIGSWQKREGNPGLILLREWMQGDMFFITVEDNGPGIPPRHIDHIFRMGYSTKFDPATGNIYRGVGLYGVKMTVEETFGGSICVESEKDKGTTFTIEIPVRMIRAGKQGQVQEK